MRPHTLFRALLVSALLPAAAGAASITVWEHADFRGATATFDRPWSRLSDQGWNDRISSLRVDSGRWEICRENDFSGCRVLAGPGEMRSMDSAWNDAVSSLRPLAESGDETAEGLAKRLYLAILGRDAEPEGLRNAAAQIERGQTANLIAGMTQSSEYRNLRASRSPEQIVDQIYRGLYEKAASNEARRTLAPRIQRGEDAQVVLSLLSSDAPPPSGGSQPPPSRDATSVHAEGAGLFVSGSMGRYAALSAATVQLTRDGNARIDFTGAGERSLTGTWTRQSDDVFSIHVTISDVDNRRAEAAGTVTLDGGRLARIEVRSGTLGARSQIVLSWISDDYSPPREETLCQQEARSQVESDRGAPIVLFFLVPERASTSSGRDRVAGNAIQIEDPALYEYRCDVDTRNGRVISATVDRR